MAPWDQQQWYIPLLWVESDKVRRSGQIWEASAAPSGGCHGGDDDGDGGGDRGADDDDGD